MSLADPYSQFCASDVDRITRSTFVRVVEHYRELSSTNTEALRSASHADATIPLLILADRQSAGRGRGDKQWWSADGAATFSLVLGCETVPDMAEGPSIGLTAGLAVCEAMQQLSPGLDAALKWPNDVYVRAQKICGILVETCLQPVPRVVVGIGINVNNSLERAPEVIRATATSLVDVAGYPFRLSDVVIAVLNQFTLLLDSLRNDPLALQRMWETHCMLTGREVHVSNTWQTTAGVCQGIGSDGALLIETKTGVVACRTGEVVAWD